MFIEKQFINLTDMPHPIKLTTFIYISCLLGYNIFGTYVDSARYLKAYRSGKLNDKVYFPDDHKPNFREDIRKKITSDWEAVKYGAQVNSWTRLWDSIVWPITTIQNAVPALVLALNPAPPTL
jgi:hypothetical protein